MRLKNQMISGIILMAVGLVFWIAFSVGADESMLSSLGSVLIILGLARLIRACRIRKNPEKAREYEAYLNDERMVFIENKARAMTFYVCIEAQLAASVFFTWWLKNNAAGRVLCLVTCFQCMVYMFFYRVYAKKF